LTAHVFGIFINSYKETILYICASNRNSNKIKQIAEATLSLKTRVVWEKKSQIQNFNNGGPASMPHFLPIPIIQRIQSYLRV